MSALRRCSLKSVHFGDILLQEFLKNSSGAKIFVRLKGVSTLGNVRFREVPLYMNRKLR